MIQCDQKLTSCLFHTTFTPLPLQVLDRERGKQDLNRERERNGTIKGEGGRREK